MKQTGDETFQRRLLNDGRIVRQSHAVSLEGTGLSRTSMFLDRALDRTFWCADALAGTIGTNRSLTTHAD